MKVCCFYYAVLLLSVKLDLLHEICLNLFESVSFANSGTQEAPNLKGSSVFFPPKVSFQSYQLSCIELSLG